MFFTDSHAHLNDERFASDLAQVIEDARAAEVERILTIGLGTSSAEFESAIALAGKHPQCWAALGVHPHDAAQATPELLETLATLMDHPRILAWGEIGLDYHYDNSPRDIQKQVFRQQLQQARKLKLPIIIHCREAWKDCMEILGEEWAATGLGGILHCFSDTLATARQALGWGFLISFAGVVTFPKAEDLRAVAGALPLEVLLIETDCPYLAPQPWRGKRNEPAYVVEVASELARLHGISREEVGERTTENFLRLFPAAK